jgi:hypothetical protein
MIAHAARTGALLLLVLIVCHPALAQIDFAGEWAQVASPQRTQQIDLGDWLGMPLNDDARARAESWAPGIISAPEWQCRPHGATHILLGASPLKIWKEVDPVTREIVAFHAEWLRSVDNPIYMDGRPHPSENAAHSWAGFSTGEWIGDMLKITTTHLKEAYLERNGVPNSDLATLTQYWIRNEDFLTWIWVVHDPVYLTEPFVRSVEYRLDLHQQLPPYPCDVIEEVERARDVVPQFLPGTNPFISDFTQSLALAEDAILGGAETMYPEFRLKLETGEPGR